MNTNKPEIIIKNQQIDFELTELLGSQPSDFIVLCFDGVQFDDFGTPYDSPKSRLERQGLIDRLNDRSEKSLWPEMWLNWKEKICKQFGLSDSTTDKDYHPVVSYKISRVCVGYSHHMSCAVGLFETVHDKINDWRIRKFSSGVNEAMLIAKNGKVHRKQGDKMPQVIAEVVKELLLAELDSLAKPKI